MPILDSVPTVQAEDPQALIEEAKRHRRQRRWFTACVVALVATGWITLEHWRLFASADSVQFGG
jgi:hypothetical protein